jgi:hypothetical protein
MTEEIKYLKNELAKKDTELYNIQFVDPNDKNPLELDEGRKLGPGNLKVK